MTRFQALGIAAVALSLTCRGRFPTLLVPSLLLRSALTRGAHKTRLFADLGVAMGSHWVARLPVLPAWVAYDGEPGMWEWWATVLDHPMVSRSRDEEAS